MDGAQGHRQGKYTNNQTLSPAPEESASKMGEASGQTFHPRIHTETDSSSQLYIAVRRIPEQSQLRKKGVHGLVAKDSAHGCMVMIVLGQHNMARRLWWERSCSLYDSRGAKKAQESQGQNIPSKACPRDPLPPASASF